MHEESECDYKREEVSGSASLKTELPGMLIGKREFPLFGISEFDERVMTAQDGIPVEPADQ